MKNPLKYFDFAGAYTEAIKKYPPTKKVKEEMTLNCPRCNAPVFVKLDKDEWRNPKYPIYECQSCSYNEERFD